MAVLSKIRERSLALIAIIGLALFAFVLDPSTLSDFFSSSKVNEIGEVSGETISREEFAGALENYKKQTGNRVSEMQAAQTVWDNLVREKIFTTKLEEAGITVGEEDVIAELIEQPSIKNNPQYQNEAGFFDKSKFIQFLATTRENDADLWSAWQNYMFSVKTNLQRNTYNNLVSAGLGASLKEGELQYLIDNTKISGQYLYVPYTSIPDSLVTVSKSDISAYINANKNDFIVKASRDISYVKFDIKPSFEDEEAIKNEVAKLIEDRKEYSAVTKGEITVDGLKNATNLNLFFEENNSDLPLETIFNYKNQVSKEIVDQVFDAKEGDVFGPYKDKGYFKLTKVTEISRMPDSVKARHILIPFLGSRAASQDTNLTEEQASKRADSLVRILKRNRRKFPALAKAFSADKSNSEKGGSLDKFSYNRMVPEFRDFAFSNKRGSIGVVKTDFGFHVIEIENQTGFQKVVKLATFGKLIVPSENTENEIFQKAEKFSLAVSENGKFFEAASDNKYITNPAIGLTVLGENIPGLGNQREIVRWTFQSDSEIGDYKRFDIEGGHVVAFITSKTNEGLMSPNKAINQVKPILLKEKKAALIQEKFSGSTLEEVAVSASTSLGELSDVTFKTSTISGVGFEPKVVGAMSYAKKDKLYKGIEGNRGIFAFVVNKKELPTALPTYESLRNQIASQRKAQTTQLYNAVKEASEIEDYRPSYYGVN